MKNSGRNTAHQRKIYLTVLIIIIILAAVFVGVYYLWKQTKTESEMKVSGQAERSQTQNDADTIEYQGSTYKYNDHLSNYLFMELIPEKMLIHMNLRKMPVRRIPFSGFHGQSNRATESSVYSKRFHDKN